MRVLAGVGNARRALGLIKQNPQLIPWALLPALITFGLSVIGIWLAVEYGDDVLATIWPEPEEGIMHWVWVGTMSLLRLATSLLTLFITPWLVILMGIPLCEPLACRADALLGGQDADIPFLKSLRDATKTGLMVAGIGLTGSIVFFVMGLIPGIGLITGPCVLFVWTPLILCFDLQDGPLSRRDLDLSSKLKLISGRPVESIVKGLIFMALLAVPVLNLIGLPIAVVAGVIAVREMELNGELGQAGT